MIKLKIAAFSLAVLAAVAVSASAQSATQAGVAGAIPDGKVAVINTAAFPSQIGELKVKYEQVEGQYKQRYEALQGMETQLKQMEEEIKTKGPSMSQDALRQLQDRYDDMKKRGTREYEDLKAELDKARENATRPIYDKLSQFIQNYATQRGIVLILNLPGAAQTGSLAYVNPGADITQDFITEYNKANPVAGGSPPPPAATKPATKPAPSKP